VKAARLHAYREKLRLDEQDPPKATAPYDVVVRIGGAGLCRTDLHIQEGKWREKTAVTLPYTLGHENAGWVYEVGSAVTHLGVGDSVIVHPLITCGFCRACRAGDDMHCVKSQFPGINADGGFADFLKTSARSLIKLDERLQPKDVAALADAGLTAYHAAKKVARIVYPGCKVVVIGAGGGLGHIAIQSLKKLAAAEIVALDMAQGGLELARQVGADYVVPVDGTHIEKILELTGGKGADALMDFVGEKDAVEDGIRMLRRAGSYLVIGYGGSLNIPTIDIISSEINFVGNLVGTFNELIELMTLAAQQKVRLQTKVYPLDAINDAMADLESGRLHGRAILVPSASQSEAAITA
jgi:NAD+-dependent secondary alcohol dehydrogenase Adh1